MKSRTFLLTLAALLTACGSSPVAPPIAGDDPSAIVGQYLVKTVNGAPVPATLSTTDTLTITLGDASVWLYADGTYRVEQYLYEIRPALTSGLPRPGTGRFALHGSVLDFVASSGVAPESATVTATGLRVVASLRAGRKADTLAFTRGIVLSAGESAARR